MLETVLELKDERASRGAGLHPVPGVGTPAAPARRL